MRDFQWTLSVEPIGDAFAVVRVEQWRHDLPPGIAPIVRNRIMADGPFHRRTDAETALARLRDQRGSGGGETTSPPCAAPAAA